MFNIFKKSTNAQDLSQSEWRVQSQEDKNAVIIDVRTAQECSGGIIEGAKNIDFFSPSFKQKIAALDKSKNYYVYCRSGNRSSNACNIMKEMGFENTFNLVGGWMQWKGPTATYKK
jgi:rhodanese-related sulfurtransferase